MQLRDYINAGINSTGSQRDLADHLGTSSQQITNAKAQRAGLPNDACVKLATLIHANPLEVIAASELATEKKVEKREFWSHLLGQMSSIKHAHFSSIVATLCGVVFALQTASEKVIQLALLSP